MSQIKIPIESPIYQRLTNINSQLQAKSSYPLSKILGQTLTQLTCHVLDHVFGTIARQSQSTSEIETEQTLQQINQQLEKYMPWAISLFSNERLAPLSQYIFEQFEQQGQYVTLNYEINDELAQRIQSHFLEVERGNQNIVPAVFADLVNVVNAGIDQLILKPKTLLKFNFVIDKTLNGVIQMLQHAGTKRLEKLGNNMSVKQAQQYIEHFQKFIVYTEVKSHVRSF